MTDPEEMKSVEQPPKEEKPPTEEEEKPEEKPPAEEEKPPAEPPRTKRKYQKRKMKILQDEEKKQQPLEEEEEAPPQKKVRVTKQEDIPPVPEPSFLRGAIVKPLLLGLLASGSFLVNHMFQTHVSAPVPPLQQKKNATQKAENLRNEIVMLPSRKKTVRIPGFD